MTKYHAHEALIATGPATDNLPTSDELCTGIRPELHDLIIGPVVSPGSTDGITYATYVFLPDGEDSWSSLPPPALDGAEARELFTARLKQWLPGVEIVRVQYGTKAYSEAGRYDTFDEDVL